MFLAAPTAGEDGETSGTRYERRARGVECGPACGADADAGTPASDKERRRTGGDDPTPSRWPSSLETPRESRLCPSEARGEASDEDERLMAVKAGELVDMRLLFGIDRERER